MCIIIIQKKSGVQHYLYLILFVYTMLRKPVGKQEILKRLRKKELGKVSFIYIK